VWNIYLVLGLTIVAIHPCIWRYLWRLFVNDKSFVCNIFMLTITMSDFEILSGKFSAVRIWACGNYSDKWIAESCLYPHFTDWRIQMKAGIIHCILRIAYDACFHKNHTLFLIHSVTIWEISKMIRPFKRMSRNLSHQLKPQEIKRRMDKTKGYTH
jgi:hypothetical protein